MGNDESLEAIRVPGEATPSVVTPEVVGVTEIPREQLQDIPDVYPRLVGQPNTVEANPNGCLIPPESVTAFGQNVTLRLVIDSAGRVQEAIVQSSSNNSYYDDLARCILERTEWAFEPATVEGIATLSDSLEITINLR